MTSWRPAQDVAWTTVDDTAYVANVPSGPILVLAGPAAVIWEELSADGDLTTLTARVTKRMTPAPPDADATVKQVVTQLRDEGFLTPTQGTPEA